MSKPLLFFLLVLMSCSSSLSAQKNKQEAKQKIAVFLPLYLDSVFDASTQYRYDSIFPKFINPGLEFYEGIQTALDSLNKENYFLEVFIFDSKSNQKTIEQQLTTPALSNLKLIIAHTTAAESQQLADIAKSRQIPLLNVNLPNDATIRNNPWFILLNPSLKSHIEEIGKIIEKEFFSKTITVFRKKGAMEDLISYNLLTYNQTLSNAPLKFKFVDLPDKFSLQQLVNNLDSTQQNICLVGSLDEAFCRHLLFQLSSISQQFPLTIFGMPTTQSLSKDFAADGFKSMTIYYGQPFHFEKSNKLYQSIFSQFQTLMQARPTDMFFRGYEVMLKYAQLLRQYNSDLVSHLTVNDFNVFTSFDIRPVINSKTLTLDYFENKNIYLIKWQDGVMTVMN